MEKKRRARINSSLCELKAILAGMVSHKVSSSRTDNTFVGTSQISFGPTKGEKLRNLKTHVIWANQKTDYCVYHAMFDIHVTCCFAFVRASDMSLEHKYYYFFRVVHSIKIKLV